MPKLLGIDYGEARIGVAISDQEGIFVFGRPTITNDGMDKVFQKIKDICRQENIKKIIIGLPLDQSGRPGPAAKKAGQFGAKLAAASGIIVEYEDERFSSQLAKRFLQDAAAKKSKKAVDRQSARIILQSYLDKKNGKIPVN